MLKSLNSQLSANVHHNQDANDSTSDRYFQNKCYLCVNIIKSQVTSNHLSDSTLIVLGTSYILHTSIDQCDNN